MSRWKSLFLAMMVSTSSAGSGATHSASSCSKSASLASWQASSAAADSTISRSPKISLISASVIGAT